MTTMTTKCFYDKMINASNNKKKLLLLSSTAIAKVCVLQKKAYFLRFPQSFWRILKKKTSQPPPTELILLKSKRKRKSSPSLYVSWFIICPPKKIYCTTTAFITLLHPWFYLKKRKWTRKKNHVSIFIPFRIQWRLRYGQSGLRIGMWEWARRRVPWNGLKRKHSTQPLSNCRRGWRKAL